MDAIAPADDKTRREWLKKDAYCYAELIQFGNREFGMDLPPLPLPPMLMLHRVVHISETGGKFGKGFAIGEYDVRPNDWYFPCHFKGRPIMPGVLGIDAVFQLGGFFLAWSGARGDGMATGMGGLKFRGMVTPDAKLLQFVIDAKHLKLSPVLNMVKFDGRVIREGETIYEMEDLTVGVAPQKQAA